MDCTAQGLVTGAKCILQCVPPGQQPAAQTALLDLINGGPTAINVLLQNGKEYIWKVPPRMQVPLHIYLLLVILEGQGRTVQELLQSASCMKCIPPGFQPAVHTYEICEWSQGGGSGETCDDPVVIDWLARLAADFQPIPSDETLLAICDFCRALRVTGIMDKMLVVNPIIPDSFLAMRYPLIYQVGNGSSPFINHNFVAADLDNNGLVGDGATKYFDTGFIPSGHWASTESAGISFYESDTTPGIGDEIEVGCEDGGTATSLYLGSFLPPSADLLGICWDVSVTWIHADSEAFYSMDRISNTELYAYRNAVQVASDIITDQSGLPIPGMSVHFMALNGIGAQSGKRISFMAIHEGLTQPEVLDFYNAVYDLRVALGGGYV